jgi:hypothetical protein
MSLPGFGRARLGECRVMSSSALTRKVHRVRRHVGDLSIHAQAQAIARGRAADRVEHGCVGRTESALQVTRTSRP